MNAKANLLKTLIRQSIVKNIVNEEFKKGGNLEKWLNKQVADGKIKGLDLGNQIQVKLLNDVLAYIDSEVVEYAIERESDEAGLYREAADTNTVYYVKKNGAMYQTVMMIESGDNATVSDKLHDGIIKAGSKLWPSWGNYSLDDRACAAFLTAYFADRSWFSGTKPEVKSIQQLPRLMWPDIKARAGKQIKENHKMNTKANLLKTLIREEVKRQLREVDDEAPESSIDASQPVDMVISKIKKGPVMSSISKISNDTQKAQLIMKFAELVGVPKNKLLMVLQTIRKTAQ